MNKIKEFKFSRTEALLIFSIFIGIFIYSEFIIYAGATRLLRDQFLILNLFALVIFVLLILFASFFYSDIILRKNSLEVIYLGRYLFGLPPKKVIPFKDIVKVNKTYIHPTFASIKIFTKNDSVIVFYMGLDKPFEFLKTLISRIPKTCRITGFKFTKAGDLE